MKVLWLVLNLGFGVSSALLLPEQYHFPPESSSRWLQLASTQVPSQCMIKLLYHFLKRVAGMKNQNEQKSQFQPLICLKCIVFYQIKSLSDLQNVVFVDFP